MVHIVFRCDTAAFEGSRFEDEVAAVLGDIAVRIGNGKDMRAVYDSDGEEIGEFAVTDLEALV